MSASGKPFNVWPVLAVLTALLLLSLLLAGATTCRGDDAPPQLDCWDAVCDLSAPPYGGSGVLAGVSGDRGVVLTCSHTFHGGSTRNVTCRFRSGYRANAKFLGMVDNADLAAFEIEVRPDMVTPAAVTDARQDDGPFTAVGFPWYGQGKMHYTSGKFVRKDSGGRVFFNATPTVHSGFSGGALFNRYGELVGIISGFDDDGLSIAGSGRTFLDFAAKWTEVRR